jgi:hypothetical protein
MNYDRVHHIVACYFSHLHGLTEEEGPGQLRAEVQANQDYGRKLKSELLQALSDNSFPWKELLAEHDIEYFDEDSQAREFARKYIFQSIFP